MIKIIILLSISVFFISGFGSAFAQTDVFYDEFDDGLNGWNFGYACNSCEHPIPPKNDYSLSITFTDDLESPFAMISGDGFAVAAWMEKSITLPDNNQYVVLSFDGKASGSLPSHIHIPNLSLNLFDRDGDILYHKWLIGDDNPSSTETTAWQSFQVDITEHIPKDRKIKISLGLDDSWTTDYRQSVWFDNIRLTLQESPPNNSIVTYYSAIQDNSVKGTLINTEKIEIKINDDASVPGCEKTNDCFSPNPIVINPGQRIVWNNTSTAVHAIANSEIHGYYTAQLFRGMVSQNDGTFSHTFTDIGDFDYFCQIHPWMTGTILVESENNSAINNSDLLSDQGPCMDLESFYGIVHTEPFFEDFEKYCYDKNAAKLFAYAVSSDDYDVFSGITHDYLHGKTLHTSVYSNGTSVADDTTVGNFQFGSFHPDLQYVNFEMKFKNLSSYSNNPSDGASTYVLIEYYTGDKTEKVAIVPDSNGRVMTALNNNDPDTYVINLMENVGYDFWDKVQFNVKHLYEKTGDRSYSDVKQWSLNFSADSHTSKNDSQHGWDLKIDNLGVYYDNTFEILPPFYQSDDLDYSEELVLCKSGYALALHISANDSICVKETSVDKLMDRKFLVPFFEYATDKSSDKLTRDKQYFADMISQFTGLDRDNITADSIDEVKQIILAQKDLLIFADDLLYDSPNFILWYSDSAVGIFTGEQMSDPQSSIRASGGLERLPIVSLDSAKYNLNEYVDYSSTNLHVMGVDEADFVKNNANDIYVINSENKVVSTDHTLEYYSDILNPDESAPFELFLHNDKLIVVSIGYPKNMDTKTTDVLFYDIKDNKITKTEELTINYPYHQARMIGDTLYVMTEEDVLLMNQSPMIQDKDSGKVLSTSPITIFADRLLDYPVISTISAIDSINPQNTNSKSFVTDRFDILYVSENNIYFTHKENTQSEILKTLYNKELIKELIGNLSPYMIGDLYHLDSISYDLDQSDYVIEMINYLYTSNINRSIVDKILKTPFYPSEPENIIHKISLDNTAIQYIASGKVPGKILNEFSLDEDDKHLRIVSNIRPDGFPLQTAIYVLDDTMEIVGDLANIAANENIHSVRFAGDLAYIVTFRQVDPFFVVDVSTTQPKLLGELKIPGFSNYLQNYDDEHVIGIGRSVDNGFFQGLKISMFDVSEFDSPVETSHVIIGSRSADSVAADSDVEHKSVYIDSKNQLISIPVMFDEKLIFYVYSVSDDYTLKEHSQISHELDHNYEDRVRTFFIGDKIYTVTPNLIKANSITNMDTTLKKLSIVN